MRFELQKQLGRFCIYDTWAMGGSEVCMYFDHAYEEQALMALRIFNEYENHKNNAIQEWMLKRIKEQETSPARQHAAIRDGFKKLREMEDGE